MGTIHHLIPYIIFIATVVSGIYSGITMFEELELLEQVHVTFTNKTHRGWLILFITVWTGIYLSYYFTTLFSYKHLDKKSTLSKIAHDDKRTLIILFAIALLVGLLALVVFFKTRHVLFKIASMIFAIVSFLSVLYQVKLLSKYKDNFIWWLNVIYAVELLFSTFVVLVMIVEMVKLGGRDLTYNTYHLFSKHPKLITK